MRIGEKLVLLLAAAAVAATVACGGTDDGASVTPGTGRKVVLAPVDALELVIRQDVPPRYSVRIASGLPSGCAEFNEARITGRSGATITIEVTNTMPSDSDVPCTAIYGTHEETVELDFEFDPGREYVLRANEKELRFKAQ